MRECDKSKNTCKQQLPIVYMSFNKSFISVISGARGGAVDWGTELQGRRPWVLFPMVLLKFFIFQILPVALWQRGWLSL